VSLLRVASLHRAFGGVVVADDVTLSLEEGSVQALIGPNGAGKSTFVNLVTGFLRPARGTIEFGGADVTRWSPARRRLAGMARTFQTPRVLTDVTAARNLLVALRAGRPTWRLATTLRASPEERKAVAQALELVGLEALGDVTGSDLTHEERRLLELAMALVRPARALLLDEPTAGMSARGTDRVAELIDELRGRLTMLVIDHDMTFIRRLDAPVAVLHRGAIIRQGTIDALERDEYVREIYLGTPDGV
jgi:ABC-type branched-subunit amino acid transport system ATPase component